MPGDGRHSYFYSEYFIPVFQSSMRQRLFRDLFNWGVAAMISSVKKGGHQ